MEYKDEIALVRGLLDRADKVLKDAGLFFEKIPVFSKGEVDRVLHTLGDSIRPERRIATALDKLLKSGDQFVNLSKYLPVAPENCGKESCMERIAIALERIADGMNADPKWDEGLNCQKTLSGVAPLARKLGVTPGHLSRVVHGERKASPALKLRLARMGITTTVDGEAL